MEKNMEKNMEMFQNDIVEQLLEEYFSFIDTVDTYLREIEETDLDDYEDFHPFIDEEDILLYRSLDKNYIIDMTKSLFLKSNITDITKTKLFNKKQKEMMFYSIICSYVLVLKYHTDCTLYKAYTRIIEILREFDDLVEISNSLNKSSNNDKIVKKFMNIEWQILKNVEFKV